LGVYSITPTELRSISPNCVDAVTAVVSIASLSPHPKPTGDPAGPAAAMAADATAPAIVYTPGCDRSAYPIESVSALARVGRLPAEFPP
jgi:hypothetical protein